MNTNTDTALINALNEAEAGLEFAAARMPQTCGFVPSHIAALKIVNEALSTAAQPHDHGPMAATIEEAARDVGKWLNERPNRPLDLRHVAMLCTHARAAQPETAAVVGSSDVNWPAEFAKLQSPEGVRLAMLSGTIAKISIRDCAHTHGAKALADLDDALALAAPTTQAPQPQDALRCAVGNCKFNGEVAEHAPGCPNAPQPVEPAVSQGVSLMPDIDSLIVNETGWKFVQAMPYPLPAPIWNNLKPALYAALKYFQATQSQEAAPTCQLLKSAWDRMDRARGLLTGGNPRPDCNWGMLDTSADRTLLNGQKAQEAAPFQQRVQPWMMECFGPVISSDLQERNHRFLEEALELVQTCGCTQSEARQLVDYVYGRPWGEPSQEVGGVMVTLAALCLANGIDMHEAGETELSRISDPEMTAKIRAKQAAKPKHSPLPAAPSQDALTQAAKDVLAERQRQIDVEGWTPEHDDKKHLPGEMALAAASYVCAEEDDAPPAIWPWDWKWWKPTGRRRNLVKAGALIMAEIECIDRAARAREGK